MKRIKFSTMDEYVPIPKPSVGFIPDWYKKAPKFTDGRNRPFIESDNSSLQFSNKGVKHCIPFLDAITCGYTAELWEDVQVVRTKEGPQLSWPVDPPPISSRSSRGLETLPVPPGFMSTQFLWMSQFVVQTPPGYSVLISHPLNRFDLPFLTMSAVVDSDSILGAGHIPFYLKEDFEGIIEAGTPIFQMIPFKREPWTSEEDRSLTKKADKRRWQSLRRASGVYRDIFWSKKSYE